MEVNRIMYTNSIPSALLERGTKRIFTKDSHIFKTGDSIAHCYYIISGTVKIYIDHKNGRRSVLDFISANNWLGELSVFCCETDVKENKVLQEVVCLEFEIHDLRKLSKENSEVSFYFASYISNKLLNRSSRMSENLNFPLENRLASFILEYHHNLVYNLPHVDVSEYLNVSYRHMLYVIKHFCKLEILTKQRGIGYLISDIEKLKQYLE